MLNQISHTLLKVAHFGNDAICITAGSETNCFRFQSVPSGHKGAPEVAKEASDLEAGIGLAADAGQVLPDDPVPGDG